MPTVIKVYLTNGTLVTVSLDTSFPSKLVYDQPVGGQTLAVYRVDFCDPDDDAQPKLIVPADAASTVKFSGGGDSVELKLELTVLVGSLDDRSMRGAIFCDVDGNLSFRGGLLSISGFIVTPNNIGGTPSSTPYLQTLLQLTNPGPNGPSTAPVSRNDIAPFGEGFEQFDFRTKQIAFRARTFFIGPSPDKLVAYPVLVLERATAAADDFGNLRFLPPPFSIALASSESTAGSSKIVAAQRPADAWLTTAAGAPATEWVIDLSGFPPNTVADFWHRAVVERYVGGLRTVSDALPVSLLPDFTADASEANWRLNLALSTASGTPVPSSINASSLRLLGPVDSRPAATPALAMAFPGFLDDSGEPVSFNASLFELQDPGTPTSPWIGFESSAKFALAGTGRVRVGSIDLVLDAAASTAFQCQVTFEEVSKPNPAANRKAFWIPRVASLTGATGLLDLVPGGQDEPDDPQAAAAADAGNSTDYAREAPLLFTVSKSKTSQFILNWREGSSQNQNQQLTLKVDAANPGEGTEVQVLVIDRNPFMVALAQLPSLAAAASDANATVAIFSNSFPEGSGWRIAAGASSFQLLLPPQGVGEGMVKDTSIATDQAPFLPAIKLPPPLQATLQTTVELQRFAEPPWNLRRILGYPGQRSPGAIAGELQFEMLYGLTGNVNAPNLHLSEVFSRLGGFAGPLIDSTTGTIALNYLKSGYTAGQRDQFKKLNDQWAAIYKQLLSRLGVFELWNQESLHDLVLTDGVSYDARANADPSFPGGLQFGFDSNNVLQALESNPHSSSAVLTNPRFSALGGYGKQRAAFSNDLIIVETEHAMGALESMSITLIGRIGNLWHHAKYVTVFERSVRPSRQFYLEQPQLTGRPILRKTKQYVEITQKSRAYPESGGGGIACGFVEGAEFKSIRINVDSAWGADVGKGWMVPLWRRDAQPTDIYPRPHVLLELAVDPDTGNDSLVCEVLDPEKLCFYTDPSQPAANTDIWPPVASIDFRNTPPVRSTNPSGVVKRDYAAEPGFGRFTYTLSPDASQINVVSQRASNAISSALTNVTLMRAQSGLPAPNQTLVSAGQLHDYMNNALDQLVAAARANPSDTKNQILKRLAQIDGDLVVPYTKAVAVLQGETTSICDTLGNAASDAIGRAAAPLETLWDSLFTTLKTNFDRVVNTTATAPDTLAQALQAELDEAVMALQTAMGPLLADLSAAATLAARVSTAASNLSGQLATFKTQITDTSLGSAGSAFRTACQNFLAHFRKDLDAALADAEELLASAGYLFGARLASSTAVQIQQIRDDLGTVESAFDAALSKAVSDLTAAAAAAINADIDGVIAVIQPVAAGTAAISGELTQLQALLQGAANLTNPFANAINTLAASLRATIAAVPSPFNPSDFQKVIDKLLSGAPPAFNSLVAQAQSAVQQQVSKTCKAVLGTVATAAGTVLNLLGDDLKKFLDTVNGDFATALENRRTQYIAQLDGVLQQALDAVPQTISGALDSGLSLLRAFGAPPSVPTLGFNLNGVAEDANAIAYFFDGVAKEVGLSAGLNSLVTQASSVIGQLSQLGLTMPTQSLLDRLVPSDLSKLNLSDLLPHIAGLDLSSLFSGITVPAVARDNIVVSHRIDPQTLRAALDVAMNFPLSGPATLFSIGPATVTLDACVFQAAVHVAGGIGQPLTRSSTGSISADWHVVIGGTEIVTFVSTTLSFDEAGHLHFDIAPERVRLASVLQFLADFLQSFDLGGGFSLNLLPTGVQCILNLPFPDMSFGAFGISNLALGSVFELDVSSGLVLRVGANLGRQESPFTLTIFILGGAGWFEATVSYTIGDGSLTADVSIGILAAATLSISLGPISGGLYVYFGITAEFHSQGGGLTLGILLLMQGRVSLLGILDVDITLLLEAEYTSGGGLIGRGQVSVSIKICWCFTLEVHANVEYTFGNTSGGPGLKAAHSAALAAPAGPTTQLFATAAAQHINYFT